MFAETQTLNINIPSVNNVAVTGGNVSSSIDPVTGTLYSDLYSVFEVSTNNKNGLMADFSVKVDTLSGLYNGSAGMVSNSNTGKCILTNSDFKPDSASVNNALKDSAVPVNNPNAIGFQINYTNQNTNGDDPVFSSPSSNVASGEVLYKKGTTTIIAKVQNNPSINSKTYSNLTDSAGSYQLTIYCTVYNP